MITTRRLLLSCAAALALTACGTTNTGVETTPTYDRAAPLPLIVGSSTVVLPSNPGADSSNDSGTVYGSMSDAVVSPDAGSMNGASWVIRNPSAAHVYKLDLGLRQATTILLPDGEQFRGAVGGDIAKQCVPVQPGRPITGGFLLAPPTYIGARPAVSIMPCNGYSRGNLQIVTSNGFYAFALRTRSGMQVSMVDVGRTQPLREAAGVAEVPTASGDSTRLAVTSPDGPTPAWAPEEAWADSRKLVVRFDAPLPTTPALFAGTEGEQTVPYRIVRTVDGYTHEASAIYLVTTRRVTVAELRLGGERVRLGADPGPEVPTPAKRGGAKRSTATLIR